MTAGFVMLLGLMAGLLLWFGPRSRLEGPREDFSMFWGNGAPAEVRGQGDGDLYMDGASGHMYVWRRGEWVRDDVVSRSGRSRYVEVVVVLLVVTLTAGILWVAYECHPRTGRWTPWGGVQCHGDAPGR